jgi:hypothetical protein
VFVCRFLVNGLNPIGDLLLPLRAKMILVTSSHRERYWVRLSDHISMPAYIRLRVQAFQNNPQ